jgi:hypothetical protein
MAPGRSSSEVDDRVGSEVHSNPIDVAIAVLAGRQYGVVSRVQLLALGLTPRMIQVRITGGRLHVIHRGVYAVGHTRIPQEGRWLAAVLHAAKAPFSVTAPPRPCGEFGPTRASPRSQRDTHIAAAGSLSPVVRRRTEQVHGAPRQPMHHP